ncbi:MAG: hypothetical protein J3R72DRAFT_18471 [Linnemannia gamsii]|nr:MAG: hypothetical protein J3R72DRAFT_18471 [Linnemannia gamsii]
MTIQDSLPHVQAVRRVFENGDRSTLSETIHLVCHSDTTAGKDILLWDDILAAFKDDVVHVRSGTIVLPFLKGPDFKNLDPLRIASVPGVTLDVVVRSQLSENEFSLDSLRNALPDTTKESSSASKISNSNAVLTVRRNPAGGLFEEAMDAYRNNDNPAFDPQPRGPQAVLDDPTSPSPGVTNPIPQKSISNSQTPAVQTSASATNTADGRMMEKATRGDKDAQFVLGDMYHFAGGVPQDYNVAMDWYLKAANQGHASAQNNIGWMYQNGHGVPQDYSTAMDWYLKAADKGNAKAQNNIGMLYQDGLDVPQDYSAAMDWFLKAGHQGIAEAQSNIGWLYHNGLGVSRDYSSAMEWYLKAVNQGSTAAQSNIGLLYQRGHGVAQDYSQAMIWFLKAADQGNATAENNVAWMYEQGLGVPKDKAKAIEWYRKAIAGGHANAKMRLDQLEQQGIDSVAGDTKRGLFRRIFK